MYMGEYPEIRFIRMRRINANKRQNNKEFYQGCILWVIIGIIVAVISTYIK